jgi:hypothetical protein
MSEKERINFIEQRDGKDKAVKFAEQVAASYVRAAVRGSSYEESIKYLIEYIKDNTNVEFVYFGLKASDF